MNEYIGFIIQASLSPTSWDLQIKVWYMAPVLERSDPSPRVNPGMSPPGKPGGCWRQSWQPAIYCGYYLSFGHYPSCHLNPTWLQPYLPPLLCLITHGPGPTHYLSPSSFLPSFVNIPRASSGLNQSSVLVRSRFDCKKQILKVTMT